MDIFTIIGWLTVVNLLLAVRELYVLDRLGRAATESEYERMQTAFALIVLLPLAMTLPKGITELYALLLAGLVKINFEDILDLQKASAARKAIRRQ